MANLVSFRSALERLGWSQAARNEATREDGQALALNFLHEFKDSECDNLFDALRRPGDTILVNGVNTPRPGVAVSARGKMNFKNACFMARYFMTTNRTLAAADITLDNVARFRHTKEMHEAHEDPSEPLKLEDSSQEKILRFIDQFPSHLRLYRGLTQVPLSYIIREERGVPDAEEDLQYGAVGSTYSSTDDELIARASLDGHIYNCDNSRVYELLKASVLQFKDVYNWIKPFNRTKNGRAAWQGLRSHYMGDAFLNNLYDKADRRLLSLVYKEELPRYDFEKHVSLHRQCHNEAEAAHRPFDDLVKVNRLLTSIQAKELEASCAVIRSDQNRMTDFDGAVNFLWNFVKTKKKNPNYQISATGTDNRGGRGGGGRGSRGGGGRGGRGRGNYRGGGYHPYGRGGGRGYGRGRDQGRGGRGGGYQGHNARRDNQGRLIPEDRFYSSEEWWNELDDTGREKVIQLRQARQAQKKQDNRNVNETQTQQQQAQESNPSGATTQRCDRE